MSFKVAQLWTPVDPLILRVMLKYHFLFLDRKRQAGDDTIQSGENDIDGAARIVCQMPSSQSRGTEVIPSQQVGKNCARADASRNAGGNAGDSKQAGWVKGKSWELALLDASRSRGREDQGGKNEQCSNLHDGNKA